MLWFRRLNLAATALCFVVVVFGAYVRLSDAGLGCPDWPGCYGLLTVPAAPHELAAAQKSFPQRPVEAPKAWKEMIHRYLASTLGLLILGLAVLSAVMRGRGLPEKLPWVLVGLVAFQGLLGKWTVTWQLKPLAVCGHLLGGMTTLALLLWMWLSLRSPSIDEASDDAIDRPVRSERHVMLEMLRHENTGASRAVPASHAVLRTLATIALAALAMQIFLGGWTSSNYAALACPDFPTCHGSYWPPMAAKEAFTLWRGLGINYEHGVLDNRARVTIHFAHRLGALVMAALGSLLVLLLGVQKSPRLRLFGIALAGTLGIQVLLGISIVELQQPLFLADMHNAGAAVLLLTLVTLNHFLWTEARAN